MAGKLKDDQIRIILDVEAKGVQAKLQQITAETLRYSDANRQMNKEMKDAEAQMKAAEKAMLQLEKAGKINTAAYKEAKGTYESAKAEVADYKQKVEANTKAIADNDKQTKEIIKTMSIQDMTMSQLKQRAADLQLQLNNTSQSLSTDAYNKLQKELTQVNDRMFTVKNAGKSMLDQFAAMNNPVGSAAQAVQGFGQALKVLITNPVGAIIMVIVGAFMLLKEAITHNGEAMNKLNQILAPFKEGFEILMTLFGKLADFLMNVLLKAFESLMNGLINVAKFFGINTDALEKFNQKTRESIELERERQQLERDAQADIIKNAEDQQKIAELRNQSRQKDKFSARERLKMIDEADKLEKEVSNRNVKRTTDDLNFKIKKYQLEGKIAKDLSADKIKMMLEEGKILGTLTEDQRKELVGLYAAVTNASTEYFKTTQRLQSQRVSALNEINREASAAAKEALQKLLQAEDDALNQSINTQKEARLQGLITEKEYNKAVERLTAESLEKKLAVKGQEKDKYIQLEGQILDAQIKRQTDADNELLTELTKAKDNQLALLDSAKNEQLKQLQETENDQKIYALRAAEIEAEAATAREEVIRAFGDTIRDTEFNNAKIREDAIEKNGNEIINAEKKTLQQQADLRKLYARTTADFERQYNIKSLQERMNDELRIIEAQHDTIDKITGKRLLSDEVYELAKTAIVKKYEDERLKIRQQYGISNLKEQYNAELELLNENYQKGLLSEEEYQQALLNLKLKYAEQYAQKAGELAKIGSDTVKAFSEAETATVSAEYTKRQSALTEQYNQGIISKEDYNKQKEELDYEEKKKTLDIQKKYADVNFAIQVADIISSGAVAAIKAFSAMASIPFVGPALGAAAAALVAITTALRVKQAKAERDRVKAMTLESPGGGTAAPQTGEIRLKEGLVEGGPNMSGGGFTSPGPKYESAGTLPVHHGEYVIASDELKHPAIMDMARSIEQTRLKRIGKRSVPGFAEGGINNSNKTDEAAISADGKLMSRMLILLDRLVAGDINVTANYGITEMEAEQKRKAEAESKFTKS